MSSALTSAARLKPEIRLAQAVSQFEADLSTEQKTRFRTYRSQVRDCPPDPSDVMRLTAEIDHRISGKVGGGRCFGPRLTNFLQAVQQFAALGDIIIGGSQNLIACGVWSVVRMSLLLVINFSSYLEKVSGLLMNVGRSAPRYQMMALLYPRSKHLQSHLSEYFIVVVRLCHQLLKFTQKPIYVQLASTLIDSDMKICQSELDLWANTIKEEVNLLIAKKIEEEAKESSQFRALSSKFSKSMSLQQKIETHLRLLNICSIYDHETSWKQTRKVGNATLFNRNAKYHDWKGRADSCTLIYEGKLGSGKSVLLANIVDNLNLCIQSKNVGMAYFFCRYDNPESLKAQTVIGSLARQLLSSIPYLAIPAELLGKTSSALDFEGVLNLLRRALPPDYKAYFILDGLDECGPTERKELIYQLRKLQERFILLLCVSFRLEPDNALKFGSEIFTAAVITSIPDNNPDIEAFVRAELESCIKSRKLVLGDPAIIVEVQDALLEKSQGMFLWVALQIESLCAMKTDDAIRQALTDLPKDLSETFSRILRKSKELGESYQRLILELVTVAYRPLTIEELREALSVIPGDTVWNRAKLLNDIYSTLACCGSLVIVDEEQLTVRLMHHSVKQFLLSGTKKPTNIAFTIESAKDKMADIIITYLNYGVFETEVSTTVVPQVMTGSAPSTIIHSTLDSSSSVRSLALKLLKSRKSLDCDIGKILAESSNYSSHRSVGDFHFHSYAKLYWLQHVVCISKQEPKMCNLLLRLFEREAVIMSVVDEDGRTLLVWAVRNGHEMLVELLQERGAKSETKDNRYGRMPLYWAALSGHNAIVQLLLDNGAELETKDSDGQTPLFLATVRGHEAVIKLLLEKGAELETKDRKGWTPLFWATDCGHEAVIKLLLEKGAELETKDSNGQTPLLWAAKNGHEVIVKLLLEKGAEPETKDSNGQTPLSWAANNGHEAIIKLLLKKGTELETEDRDGWTPLLWATVCRHEVVVKLLLEKGAKLETEDNNGQTPLSWATACGHEIIVKLLLEKGAELETKDSTGQTPLSWAAKNGHEVIVQLLQQEKRARNPT